MMLPFSVIATGQSLIHHDLRSVDDAKLQAVKSIIRSGTVAFTNFEMTVYGSYGGWPLKGSYFGCADPAVLDCLKDLGFSALSLANNHAFDLGPAGILSTIEEASRLNFLHAGTGKNRRSAARVAKKAFGGKGVALVAMDAGPGPAFMYADDGNLIRPARPGVNGLQVERRFDVDPETFDVLHRLHHQFGTTALQLVNYAQPNDPPHIDGSAETDIFGTVFRRAGKASRRLIVDPDSANRQLKAIKEARSKGLFVIAYLHHHHWEPDWLQTPEWVQEFARRCIDSGAGIFVSHGAPVLQGIEIYKNSPIFYGLGNFLFHTSHDQKKEWSQRDVRKSVIASCSFNDRDEIEIIDFHPLAVCGPEALDDPSLPGLRYPVLAEGRLAKEIIGELEERCERFGTSLNRVGDKAQFRR